MGVPKFFRYISERYPCLSEFVKEYQIPVFDNLYLDMNGIIHMCSHPDDNNPHFRITEEKIFTDIFHYIEVLFRMIKPQKVFFMAVDGVAPRAKMNQQRGRRFRSAKEAEKLVKEALKKGETLPGGDRFDSNCITPGTEFMAKLHDQLKYFVVQKISTDKMWKKCRVILSGHETPGEGEHKIMDYIRYIRSQPGYDPNTRHCLYGLDADLMMLGLCTHDPHFSLLREEVKFGKKTKRSNVPEEIRFYLLHLSLMREYIEMEFSPLKEKLKNTQILFDLEKIIDDWILMGFLIGNDFIPNLPNLHIANGALPVLYQAYMEVLPTLDGYINEAGTLNLERFEAFMRKLGDIDFKNFEEAYIDLTYMESKTGRKQAYHLPVNSKPISNEYFEEENTNSLPKDPALAALIAATDELDVSSDDEDESDKSSSNEDEAFKSFKDEYYRNKLEFHKVTPEIMRNQAEGYVRAIQWNLNYYYNGVCSWSWFYPHHYSPYISDIKGFSNLKIDFELGKPFKPYEQLLAVLPAASKNLLPKCYHHLMTDEHSIIKPYYPENFETDLNGKRQEWEAVVLVPFIDENLLLEAMKSCNDQLSEKEFERNKHGPMLVYEYTDESLGVYQSPGIFPNVENHARCTPITIDDIRVPQEKLVKGAYPNARFDVFYPGFPTFKHLKYESELRPAKVKVFDMPSRNENMILRILPNEIYFEDSIPVELLGTIIWVGWPHLVEAKVVALSNRRQKYIHTPGDSSLYKIEDTVEKIFNGSLDGVTVHFRDRMGIEFGKTHVLVHVQLMSGRKYVFTSGRRVNLEKQFDRIISNYPLQSIVTNIAVHDEYQSTFTDLNEVFPIGCICFSLINPHYGSQGTVLDSSETLKNNQLKVSLHVVEEPDFKSAHKIDQDLKNSYMNLTTSASYVALSNYVFSRITGSLYIAARNSEGGFKNVNIGLDLKFNKKNQETPGYTCKFDNTWCYTDKAVDLVRRYYEKFPEIFHYLSSRNDDEIMADNIFNNDADEKVKSIQVWLRTLPTHNIERRVCGSTVLEPEVITEIEKIVDGLEEKSKDLILQIKPQHLYKPEIQTGNLAPDALAKTKIFDRVVNTRDGFTVPLGLKGTVIAIQKSAHVAANEDELYDIVFDKPFPGGMAIHCSPLRGYRLPKSSFINLSHGKRQMEQKTGVPGALRTLAKEQRANNFNMHSTNGNLHLRKQNSAFASFNKVAPPVQKNFQYNQFPNRVPQVPLTQDTHKFRNPYAFIPDFKMGDHKPNKENTSHKKSIPINQFMPKFAQNSQNVFIPSPSGNNLVPASLAPKVKTEVDTDFLKRILNINNSGSSQPTVAPKSQPRAVTKREAPANIFPNSATATARLLSYYQSNLLGCPRYTYLEEEEGFSAQLTLPNGKIICGKVAKTREDASENVALDALNLLQNVKPNTLKEGLPSQFPVPPTKWVQNQQQNKLSSQVFVNRSHQGKVHQKGASVERKRDPESSRGCSNVQNNGKGSSNNSTNFVPLQALKKRQANRPTNSANKNSSTHPQSAKSEKNNPVASVSQSMNVSKGCGNTSGDRFGKKGKQRKTRIAANFKK